VYKCSGLAERFRRTGKKEKKYEYKKDGYIEKKKKRQHPKQVQRSGPLDDELSKTSSERRVKKKKPL